MKSEWQGGSAEREEVRVKMERMKEKKAGRDGTDVDEREAEAVDSKEGEWRVPAISVSTPSTSSDRIQALSHSPSRTQPGILPP
jgi:hypothetical protein